MIRLSYVKIESSKTIFNQLMQSASGIIDGRGQTGVSASRLYGAGGVGYAQESSKGPLTDRQRYSMSARKADKAED